MLGFHLCRWGYWSLNKTRAALQRTIDAKVSLIVVATISLFIEDLVLKRSYHHFDLRYRSITSGMTLITWIITMTLRLVVKTSPV